MKKTSQVYQFKISLEYIKPPIWRRIQVPETYTFWDLHVAIQDSMGWLDYHLHQFDILNPDTEREEGIGIPDEDEELEILPGWEVPISSYFSLKNPKAQYLYDFGDGWDHQIMLEKILAQEDLHYPICIAGERACPPEDCGGVWGYENLLDIIKDKKHKDYKETTKWLGKEFNPEEFSPERVKFDNPQDRWKMAFEDAIEF